MAQDRTAQLQAKLKRLEEKKARIEAELAGGEKVKAEPKATKGRKRA